MTFPTDAAYRRRSPAIGLTDHVWSWEEFLTYRHYHYSEG